MSKKALKHQNLSHELLNAVERFIEANYLPEEESVEEYPIWKEYATEEHAESERKHVPEEDEDLFDAERIEMENGAPVLSRPEEPSYGAELDYDRAARTEAPTIDEYMLHVEDSFSTRLLQLIDEKGYTDAEVYKRAHIDRKLFSKIRSGRDYIPRKRNVVALALALHLSLDEASDLLRRAGMALSPSSKSDLIAQYCLENGIYDVNTVNDLLDEYGEPILG